MRNKVYSTDVHAFTVLFVSYDTDAVQDCLSSFCAVRSQITARISNMKYARPLFALHNQVCPMWYCTGCPSKKYIVLYVRL